MLPDPAATSLSLPIALMRNDTVTGDDVTPPSSLPPPPPSPPVITMDEEHEHKYDKDNLGLLTQYIGPRPSQQITTTTNTEDRLAELEMKLCKEKYAQETHSLDRACNHWEALKAA